jgi:hypothetical protein
MADAQAWKEHQVVMLFAGWWLAWDWGDWPAEWRRVVVACFRWCSPLVLPGGQLRLADRRRVPALPLARGPPAARDQNPIWPRDSVGDPVPCPDGIRHVKLGVIS